MQTAKKLNIFGWFFLYLDQELRKEIDAGLKHKQRGTYYS